MSLDRALKKITTGIYIVTSKTRIGNKWNGSLLDIPGLFFPSLVMVAIKQGRRSHLMIERGKVFAVNILNKEQKEMVPLFKNKKFSTTIFEIKKTGTPIIKDVLAFLDCKLISKVTPGDHTLFIGEVLEGGIIKEGTPLSSHDLENTYGGLGYN